MSRPSPLVLTFMTALGLLGAGQAHAYGTTIAITGDVAAECTDGTASYADTLPLSLYLNNLTSGNQYTTDSFQDISGPAFYHLLAGEESDLSPYYGANVARTRYYGSWQTDTISLTADTTFGTVSASMVRDDAPLLGAFWVLDPLGGAARLTAFSATLSNVANLAGDLCTVSLGAPTSALAVTIYDETMDSDGDGVDEGSDLCPTVSALGYDAANGDGCPDDTDYDGVTDVLDACPGTNDTVDANGNGIPDGCDTGPFDTDEVSFAITGSVPATCTDAAGASYADTLGVAFEASYDADSDYTYYDYAYGAQWGASAYWTLDASVTVGAETHSLSTTPSDAANHSAAWVHSSGTGYTNVESYFNAASAAGGDFNGYLAVDGASRFDDVRDHLAPGTSAVQYLYFYGSVLNLAGDACFVNFGFDADYDSGGFTATVTAAMTDSDGDGVGDDADICSGFPNVDSDDDATCDASDVCPTDYEDADEDNDGVCDVVDVCIGLTNLDADGDQVCDDQDLCEGNDATGDTDADHTCDADDNCPEAANAGQADADGDTIGDACEADSDIDGLIDDLDNCPTVGNMDQGDVDSDGAGDACDSDDDDDGVADASDNCPIYANADQGDFDADGYGNPCDGDDDADGVVDDSDACQGTPLDAPFDSVGCSGAQRVELVCGEPQDYTVDRRGNYVACVTREATSAWRSGLITQQEKALLLRASIYDVWLGYVSRLGRWN
ncbi:MAG: thrombospondin type 3 repeat-containing protein [Pseudomonadota bacterium]|nr:thrombospondin type 3 repeat-containing protein [Pseudomonadota bacterium]